MKRLIVPFMVVAALAVVVTPAPAEPSPKAAPHQPVIVGGALPPPNIPGGVNHSFEPELAVDGAGIFWAASNSGTPPGSTPDATVTNTTAGVEVWKSVDGGLTYQWVGRPLNPLGPTGPGLSGSDPDITVARVKNSQGFYNLFVTGLPLPTETPVSFSSDGGKTWSLLNLAGADFPEHDRPWLAPDGACGFYIATQAIALDFQEVVRHYDVCDQSRVGYTTTLNPVSSSSIAFASLAAQPTVGKLTVDESPQSPYRHSVYVPAAGCAVAATAEGVADYTSAELGTCGANTKAQQWMAISRDGGATWENRLISPGKSNVIPTVWSPSVASDDSGNVYVAWDDARKSYLSSSSDGGETWSPPVVVNTTPATTAVHATVAAGEDGVVDVAFYGTDREGLSHDPSVMGVAGAADGAQWRMFWAHSIDGGHTFEQFAVGDVAHRGAVCVLATQCWDDSLRNANLKDNFGHVVSPTTGNASIVYTFDPDGDPTHLYTAFATISGDKKLGKGVRVGR